MKSNRFVGYVAVALVAATVVFVSSFAAENSGESDAHRILVLEARVAQLEKDLKDVVGIVMSTRLGTDPAKTQAIMEDAQKKSFQNACINNLRQISGSKDEYALDHENVPPGSIDALVPTYITKFPICRSGGAYTLQPLDKDPTCTEEGHSLR